jgi:deoxyguanosine kinase
MTAALISLVGPPGSGKTTAATWLARAIGGRLVLEDYAGNPFLAESYAGKEQPRLAAQCWFLLSRVSQLAHRGRRERKIIVTDYAYLQDALYARLRLQGRELAAYEALAAQVAPLVRAPDVLIWLDGPLRVLKSRIAARARGYERYFTDAFLRRQKAAYTDALAVPPCPVIRVDIARRDLQQKEQRRWLVEQVHYACSLSMKKS